MEFDDADQYVEFASFGFSLENVVAFTVLRAGRLVAAHACFRSPMRASWRGGQRLPPGSTRPCAGFGASYAPLVETVETA